MADCLSRWAYPASKGMTDVFAHGDEADTAEAKRIIEMERLMEEEGVKCFVVMAADAPSEGGRAERSGYSPLKEPSTTSTSSLNRASRTIGPTTKLSPRPLRPSIGL